MKKKWMMVSALLMMLMLLCPLICIAEGTRETGIPELDTLYPGQRARLKVLSDENARVYGRFGPGKAYLTAAGYKPYKQQGITAFFNENNWVLIDLKYQTAKERYIYLPAHTFEDVRNVPEVESLPYLEGTTIAETTTRLGPSEEFISSDDIKTVPSGTALKIFFRKDGFVYTEFQKDGIIARLWLPENDVRIVNDGIVEPEAAEEIQAAAPEDVPKGEWSQWSDTFVDEADDIEVETRILYRSRDEVEDWTDWTAGDPPAYDTYQIEVREVTLVDGNVVTEWREYGHHLHYGSWSEWSEQVLTSTGTDIVQEKTQWRFRKVR